MCFGVGGGAERWRQDVECVLVGSGGRGEVHAFRVGR